jgi:hypothetical protein
LLTIAITVLAIVALSAAAWALSGGLRDRELEDATETVADGAVVDEPDKEPSEPEAVSEAVETPANDKEPAEIELEVTEQSAPVQASQDEPDTSAAAVTPPSASEQYRMFWEQYDSDEQIQDLAEGRIAYFSLGSVNKTASQANIGVTAGYSGGGSLSGTIVLRGYSGTWYFSSITRSGGGGARPPRRPADTGVVSTIVNQQAASQDIITGFLDGGYKYVEVNSVSRGSGTATIDVTLSGGSLGRKAAQIVCVVKEIYGDKHWFVTTFRER